MSLCNILWFLVNRYYIYLVNLLLSILFFHAIAKGILKISFSNCFLLGYKFTAYCYILNMCSGTLLIHLLVLIVS